MALAWNDPKRKNQWQTTVDPRVNPDGTSYGSPTQATLQANDETRERDAEVMNFQYGPGTTPEQLENLGVTEDGRRQTPGSTAPTVRGTAAPAGTQRAADRVAAGGGAVQGSGTAVYTPDDWSAPTGTAPAAPPPSADAQRDRFRQASSATGRTGYGGVADPPPPPLSGPGAYEQWIKDNADRTRTPSRVEDLYGEMDPGYGDVDAGAYKDWRAANKDAFAGPGRRETEADNIINAAYGVGGTRFNYSAPTIGAGRDVFAAGERDLSDPGALEQRYEEMGDSFNDPGYLEYVNSIYGLDPLQNKSYSEQLYESGIDRLNPYFDLAGDRAIGKAQRASSARGGFNSGLAAQQESDILSNLGAEQVMMQERLAPVADAERRSRYDQGFKFAGQTDQERRDRINAAFGLAEDAQNAEQERFRTRGDLASIADQGTEAEGRLGLDSERARADTELRADQNRLEGLRVAGDAASDSDASYRQRILDTGDMAGREDDISLREADAERQRMRDQYDFAGRADEAERDRFGIEAGLYRDLQSTGQNRLRDAMDRTFGLDTQEAELVRTILGNASSVEKVDEAWLQAELEKMGVPLEERAGLMGILGPVLGIAAKVI